MGSAHAALTTQEGDRYTLAKRSAGRGMRRSTRGGLTGVAAGLTLLVACVNQDPPQLLREEHFSIGLGRLEHQLDLFQIRDDLFTHKTRICMDDGSFYISSGSSAKIMQFTSFGDLLLVLYDPSQNPEPVTLSHAGGEDGTDATRRAVRHELRDVGEIGVDSAGGIYVSSRAQPELVVSDAERGVVLDRIVLRFDRRGHPLSYMGQDGIGGVPFPYIEDMYVTGSDSLVVVTRTPGLRVVYWFSPEGEPLFQAYVADDGLPVDASLQATVDRIVPDHSAPVLYVLGHSYRRVAERTTGLISTLEAAGSSIYVLDLEAGDYRDFFVLPDVGKRTMRVGGRDTEAESPAYGFLGVDMARRFYLSRALDGSLYELVVLDGRGKLELKRTIVLEDTQLTYQTLHLSPEGVLSGLLCDRNKAQVVWWRCDRFLDGDRE